MTRDPKAFTVLVRNAMFQLLKAAARKDWAAAAALVRETTPETLEQHFAPFFTEHAAIRLDPSARAPDRTRITPEPGGLAGGAGHLGSRGRGRLGRLRVDRPSRVARRGRAGRDGAPGLAMSLSGARAVG